jgi:SAM-dependent methyltransferase
MFFPERIRSIRGQDRVLEVGPGGIPFHRADVFLERTFPTDDEARRQRGGLERPAAPAERIVYYDGGRFPFRDGEFDYVVCSHVVEHVADVDFFVKELSRVARGGYLEYPTVYYEYLYNFSVHLNLLKLRDGTLYHLPKRDTALESFRPVHELLEHTLVMGHAQLVDALHEVMFEGFEWEGSIRSAPASSIADLVFEKSVVPKYQPGRRRLARLAGRVAQLLGVHPCWKRKAGK